MPLPSIRVYAAIVAILGLATIGRPAEQSHIGLNQRVLVICVKTSDNATVRRTAADWVNVLTNQVNPHILQASFGQTSYQFARPTGAGVPADGWLTLPYPVTSWPGTTQGAIDAVKLADPYVNMALYNRVTIIVNSPNFGGQCTGFQWIPVSEGSESTQVIGGVNTLVRLMSVSAQNEWLEDSFWSTAAGNTRDEGASVIAHELGHHLKMPTHYGDVIWEPNIARDSITPWDLMGLSPGWNEFIAWSKIERGWLPAAGYSTVGPPTAADISTTLNLAPIQNTTGRRAIRIPFSSGPPFRGYVLEYRRNTAAYTNRNAWGDALQEGVLVTLVSEDPTVVYGHKAIVMENPNFLNNNSRATLRAGDTFEDAAKQIFVTVNSLGATANVTIQYKLPPTNYNANIQPWGAPPYETPDIWVDSEKNGWNVYRYKDAAGQPVGNGDDAWVRQLPDGSWRANRLYVRIRNTGPDPMTNVRVQMYVNSPPGLGDSGPDWAFLGTVIFPLINGNSSAKQYVMWAPRLAAHTCVRAVIEPYADETNEGDNNAQENVSAFDTTASSPYRPITLWMVTRNPTKIRMPVEYQVSGIPRRWRWQIRPERAILPAGGSAEVGLTIWPPDPAKFREYQPGQVFLPKITSLMLFGDNFYPVGGVEVWTHLVYKAAIGVQGTPNRYGIVARGRLRALQPETKGIPKAPVAVQLIYVNEERSVLLTRQVTTDEEGYFITTFGYRQLMKGRWIVQACYAGDMLYGAANSADYYVSW